jgi:hypothetical protein
MIWLHATLLLLVLLPRAVAAQSVALDDYLNTRRALEAAPDAPGRAGLEQRAGAARDALLASARQASRLLVMAERRGDPETPPALAAARLVARDGRVTLQALGGARAQSPDWERSGLVDEAAYLGLLDRLLRDSALLAHWPAAPFDPSAPGPGRAVVVRLAIGDDEHEMQALDGAPYERLAGLAGTVLEFCRSVPLTPIR